MKIRIPVVVAIVAGALLVVGGALWALWPRSGAPGGQASSGPGISLPPVLQRDTPERAMENFLRGYQAGDYQECKKWMTDEVVGFYALLGGFEAQWRNMHETAGRLERWEFLRVWKPSGDEAHYQGEVQILVRHVWEKIQPDCTIYRMAPPEVTGDHWRLGGVYMFNATCE